MKPSSALATLRHLASIRLPAKMTQPTLSLLMREVLPSDTFTILWLDEDCNALDVYSNHLCPREIANRFISHYLNTGEKDVYLPHREFMLGANRWDLLHAKQGYRNTAFFDEFARPMDFGRVLRLGVRDANKPVAAIWMTRTVGAPDFTSRELNRLRVAAPYLEHILVRDVDSPECDVPSENHGWLVADLNGAIQYLAEGTEALLHMAAGVPRNRATMSKPCHEWAGPLLKRLASRINALADGRPAQPPVCMVKNSSGCYSLRAHRLHSDTGVDSKLIGVQITRRIPLALRLLESTRVRELPPREKQVCLMLVEGLHTNRIAARMGISAHGVIQHVPSLYTRFGIHRREELLPALIPMA